MEKVIEHYIFPELTHCVKEQKFAEDRMGRKVFRGENSLIINEVFVTESNIYFNGMLTSNYVGNGTGQHFMFQEMNLKSFKEKLSTSSFILSNDFLNKIDILFEKIKEKF